MSFAGLDFDDDRWRHLLGGYRVPYDPRNALRTLECGGNVEGTWRELSTELYHQGDVGEASYSYAFQPYRPDMVQKMVDIARVYFNWCEARPFRLKRRFTTLAEELADTGHEHIEARVKGDYRRARREEYTTPAMRLGLVRKPTRLDTILYNDWRADALPPADLASKAA